MTGRGWPPAKRWRPCNGSEGEWFEAQFCAVCERDRAWREREADPCPILTAALAFDIDDEHYPPEWVEDEQGPRCTAFEPEEKLIA